MKKLIFTICCLLSMALCARPHSMPGPHRPGPWLPNRHVHHSHYYGHHYREIGAVGAGLFGAGLIASAVYGATRPPAVVAVPPAVVTAPPPPSQNVWVPGRYVDVLGPNGIVIRQWQPGHWEQRLVVLP